MEAETFIRTVQGISAPRTDITVPGGRYLPDRICLGNACGTRFHNRVRACESAEARARRTLKSYRRNDRRRRSPENGEAAVGVGIIRDTAEAASRSDTHCPAQACARRR